ncbi:hypothetical protein [Ramlibacter sp.]|uniref:hypothetical protein n=1 Tax=Ramlibacter sp. TaxID=1917967 RepID=UPI002FCA1857
MSFVFSSPLATGRSVRPAWLPAVGWFAGCVAAIALAAASLPSPRPRVAATSPAFVAEDTTQRSLGRCATCGVVERVRPLALAGAAPAGYELTVRFRDGSRRLSSHADEVDWRVGDAIMLLGGTRLAERK